MNNKINKKTMDTIYERYNRRELVNPDPLVFLYNYSNPEDRELVGIIAATLAYGRVAQILKSVNIILKFLGTTPHKSLLETSKKDISDGLKGFKHRFTTDEEMIGFLSGIKNVLTEYGTLQNLFYESSHTQDKNILPALSKFVQKIKQAGGIKRSSLLSDPEMNSACKRLNLYLRWMIRNDVVDPGGWKKISAEKLIVPLDTHMYHFGKCYGLTKRNNADMKTAIEITNGLKIFEPNDPTKYDFAITRFGIRSDMCWENLDILLENQQH
ncbi:MAG: TIGR02757 family protein [bacterium]